MPAPEPEFVRIEPGSFTMGSPRSEDGRQADEQQHEVSLTRSFWLGRTEVTQAQWKAVMGSSPSAFSGTGPEGPVHSVSWFDALAYLNARSEAEGLPSCYELTACRGDVGGGCSEADNLGEGHCEGGYRCDRVRFVGLECRGYRLPTEAEWEYAARAGSTEATYAGALGIRGENDAPVLEEIAWYGGNSAVNYSPAFPCSDWPERSRTGAACGPHPVGEKTANPWGLQDMLGNVWEWAWDWYDNYAGAATDSLGPGSGKGRVLRGGSWRREARYHRAAERRGASPEYRFAYVGFRVARSIP